MKEERTNGSHEPSNASQRKAHANERPKLKTEKIYTSLVCPEDNGITETCSTGADTSANCNHCSDCNGSCCENGVCQQSRRTKATRCDTANVPSNACCSDKKKKNILFRKSTNLFVSGVCMLVVTGVSIADIATDVLTARKYLFIIWTACVNLDN